MTKYIKIAFQKAIVMDSLKVALVVGVILNLINQWTAIIELQWNTINYLKLTLTFCVPYLVSTYASVKTELRNR
ncbi:MAG: nitrate/nitrite transporter NrtS [Chitinophagales bacterium]